MTKRTESAPEWVPAWEGLQLVARQFGGFTRAQQALALGLREGALSAAAEASAICEEEDEDFREDEAKADNLLGIPSEAWTRSAHWEADRLGWDWEAGDFQVENLDVGFSYLFYGVHFLLSEIEAIDRNAPPYDQLTSARVAEFQPARVPGRQRGPKPAHMKWSALIGAVLALERDGKLMTTAYSSPNKLGEDIQELIELDLQLDDRTIEPVVSYIYGKLLFG